MSDTFKRLYSWLFIDEQGKVVIAQFPNWQLGSAIAAWIVQFAIDTGVVHVTARIIFTFALIIWAYEEIMHGANGFRRILGAVVLVSIFRGLYLQWI